MNSNENNNIIHINENDTSLRNAFKYVWKTQQSSTGGYSVKLHHLIYTSSAQHFPIIMDIMNSSGQIQIYLKARYIIGVLKAFVHQVQKKCFLNLPTNST
jgi:hypothetical protein